jgi:hypothetical protein
MSLFEMVILTFFVFFLFFVFLNVVTRSNPKLLILFHLFYTTRNGNKIKTKNNELLIYLDEIALAYWAIDDGAWTNSGFYIYIYIHTKVITILETYRLVAILNTDWIVLFQILKVNRLFILKQNL